MSELIEGDESGSGVDMGESSGEVDGCQSKHYPSPSELCDQGSIQASKQIGEWAMDSVQWSASEARLKVMTDDKYSIHLIPLYIGNTIKAEV